MRHYLFLEIFSKTVRNILIIFFSMLFIVGGAANNGFSGFFWAIPFVVIFLIKLRHLDNSKKILLALFLTIICTSLAWNKPKNNLLYPYLNSEAEFTNGWGYVKAYDSEFYQLIAPKNIEFWREQVAQQEKYFDKELVVLNKKVLMKMDRVEVSHADFGTQLRPVFIDSDGNRFTIFPKELSKGIVMGTINSIDLKGVINFQSTWTKYLGNLMFWPMLPMFVFSAF